MDPLAAWWAEYGDLAVTILFFAAVLVSFRFAQIFVNKPDEHPYLDPDFWEDRDQ